MSTSSPELFVELDRSRPRGLRAQLERSLRAAIRTGRLRPGVRLPSSRALAADLQITRGVVIAAYQQLAAEGYLTSRQGWGTVVNVITTSEEPQRRGPPPTGVRYDFRPGAPDVGLFPHAAWARATRAAMRSLPDLSLGYGDPAGLPTLRETLADYLGRVRGMSCEPDNILVCNGFSHGLSVLARVLAERGIAVEDPGHPSWREQIEWAGASCHPIEVDDEGLRVDLLAASGRERCSPHPPTSTRPVWCSRPAGGSAWSTGRARAAVTSSRTTTTPSTATTANPSAPSKGSRPITSSTPAACPRAWPPGCGSAGWSSPRRYATRWSPPARAATGSPPHSSRPPSPSSSSAATSTDTCGEPVAATASDALIAALCQQLPAYRATGISAGLHVLVRLPGGMDATHLADTTARHGILVRPLAQYQAGPARNRHSAIVMGYSRLTPHRIEEGIHHLATILNSHG